MEKWSRAKRIEGEHEENQSYYLRQRSLYLYTFHTSGKYPCAVCRQGVGKNSIFCSGCSFLVHKKCSDIPGQVVEDPDFSCKRCLGNAQAIDRRRCVELQLAHSKLDVVDNFVYHGDCIFPGRGCELATIKRCHCMKKIQRTVTLAYL